MLEILLTTAGIVAPSLLIAFLTRRWLEPVEWRLVGTFLVLIFLFLGPAVFTADMPVPLDEVMRGYPYRGVIGQVHPRNPLTNDTVKLFLPWMQVVREELFAGRAPLWNRYSFSGYPLLANGESAPFSPFFLSTIFVPLPKQLVAIAGLKLFVSLLFSYLYLKSDELSAGSAAFGAVLFGFSVYQTVYLHYTASSVSALLPAAAFAVRLSFKRPGVRAAIFFSLVVVSLLAAGHPESVFHVALGTGAILLVELLSSKESPRGLRKPLLNIAGGMLLGLVVAAPAWVPVLEQVMQSERFAEISAEREMTPVMPRLSAYALLNPDAFGNPARGTWSWILNYSIVACSYAGLLTLALIPSSLFSTRSGRRERLLAFLAVLTFLVAMNWTMVGELVNHVPPMTFVANDKLRFVTGFLAAAAAAMAIERMVKGSMLWAAGGGLFVAALAIDLFRRKVNVTLAPYALAGVVALVLFFAVAMVLRRFGRGQWIGWAATTAAVIDLFIFNFSFNAMARREYYVPRLPIIDSLHAIVPQEPFRVLGLDWVLVPNNSAQYGLEDIRGSDPMGWDPYRNFLELLAVEDPSVNVKRIQDMTQPALDFLNVRFVLTEPQTQLDPSWRIRYAGADGSLFENLEVFPRFFTPERLIGRTGAPLDQQLRRITHARQSVLVEGVGRPNPVVGSMWIQQTRPGRFRITLDAPEPLFIASSQPATPGWKVSVNGRAAKIHRVNGAFMGFFVPAGKVRAVVTYRPLSFYGSAAVSLLTLTGVAILLLKQSRNQQ